MWANSMIVLQSSQLLDLVALANLLQSFFTSLIFLRKNNVVIRLQLSKKLYALYI